jgi:hypothetical protein
MPLGRAGREGDREGGAEGGDECCKGQFSSYGHALKVLHKFTP